MTQNRWGIAGAGFIAGMFAWDMGFTNEATVTAVGSRDLAKAQAFADERGPMRAHGSYEELIADPEVDFVYVAVPHSEHARVAELAVRAGKPVLVEKPFALNAAQAESLFELAKSEKVFVMEGMWSRFLPHMAKLREVIESGRIGEVVSVSADHGLRFDPNFPEHRLYDRTLGGGALLDLGVYPVSLVAGLLGDITEISAYGTLTATGVDAETSAVMRDAAGRHGIISTSLSTESPNRASVNGTLGRVELGYNYMIPTDLRIVTFGEGNPAHGEKVEDYIGAVEGGMGWRFEALEVGRCVRAGTLESPVVPHALTLKTLRLMDEIRRQVGVRYDAD
ncbi:Gfo/Idh/MocA family protein [Paenarthrobacter ureafaciens]|uniref:Gfo/Idh/MocA family protein n=1 Tax=Paenarthrobacter ureafaciens TaxID=37931 RepID=UPI002DB811F0|nr:Gfo/Idh/MocA family oxidoreductase [Paenarthrobacter ureafaciens]MEC3853665.1 Gfo/Idh/MocA family oxidoreductase [Paenarthrobacter ureafaciens]